MYQERRDRDTSDTIVSAAFVLRAPLEEIVAIKSAIEERGARIVYQKISVERLFISTEPPANYRGERNRATDAPSEEAR